MVDVFDLETAIHKARGAASVLHVILNHLADDEPDNWKKLRIKRWCGLYMFLMLEFERDALKHAIAAVGKAIDVISAAFQSLPKERS